MSNIWSSSGIVLVTGAAGYLGNVLCNKLVLRGYEVIAVDNLSCNQSPTIMSHCFMSEKRWRGSFTFHKLDVCNPADQIKLASLVEFADIVIPLAALVGAPICDKFPEVATDVNVNAIKNLLSYCDPKEQYVIVPTTNSGYGTKTQETVCTEDTPLTPISHYGRTKAEAEQMVMAYGNATSLRLATVFGVSPRMRLDLMVNDFAYHCFFDQKLAVFDGNFRRNFVHVNDVARAFLWCIENKDKMVGQIYNVGDDSANMTKMGLAKKISAFTGAEIIDGYGSDPDKRDYIVSSQKLYDTGFIILHSLDCGIRQLHEFFHLLSKDARVRHSQTWNMVNF